MNAESALSFLSAPDASQIAYRRLAGKNPGVVFLGGYMSDMMGTKASYLEDYCRRQGRAYVRFDYFGHGASEGDLKRGGTIGRWLQDTLLVLDKLTEGPQILVGSSMGGWLMVLAALQRPEKVHALVGIAAAPDFIEDFQRLSPAQQAALSKDGLCYLPSEYGEQSLCVTRDLIEEGRQHCILQAPISLTCPVRLLHGLADKDVDWSKSLALADRLLSSDVRLTLIKGGDHRLSSESQLQLLADSLFF